MYVLKQELRDTLEQVRQGFKDKFGHDLPFDDVFEVYKSQSTGVEHFMRIQEPVKMRGLLGFRVNEVRMARYNIPVVEKLKITAKRNGRKQAQVIIAFLPFPDEWNDLYITLHK